jgi:lipoprotein LprG
MQTRRRRLFAVLAVLSVVVALGAGCSGSKRSSAPLPDARTLVKQSADVTKTVKSAHLDLTVTGKIEKLPLKSLTGDLATTPTTAAKGNAKILLAGNEVDADFVIVDGELFSNALSPGQWADMGRAEDIVHYDPSSLLNPDTGLANLLANLTDPKAEGRDTVNGQATIRISGTVSADVINKLAPPLNASQPMPTTVWIQETGDHQLARVKLDKGSGNSVQMTLSNWNQPVQVTKPAAS